MLGFMASAPACLSARVCVCERFPAWQVLLIRLVGCCQAQNKLLAERGQPLIFGLRLLAKSRLLGMSSSRVDEQLEEYP